ncbi:hypothetical protein BA190_32965 [Labrys sp. WJW]|uniref:ferredoxin n=1 Tax=Labrys sp. WJW TaxID=1737983 RepID=UPI00082D3A2F|nr:ferredoxin [Labrys sp. WJW]OCC00610.1 hypothetical protein BA190_32965 [Labrys sp. WJW]
MWKPPTDVRPHPENCVGDFYVDDDCCVTCGVPLDLAPEIFAWATDVDLPSCVVVRQPTTPDEIYRTLAAVRGAEVPCIRYQGRDPEIGRRLVAMGEGDQCDFPPPPDACSVRRSHVTFGAIGATAFNVNVPEAAKSFLTHFKQGFEADPNHITREIECLDARAIVAVSWYQRKFHRIEFEALGDGRCLAVMRPHFPEAMNGLAGLVEKWLRNVGLFGDIRWYSLEQWQAGGPFHPTLF